MGMEYFPNYCLKKNEISLDDSGTTIGVSFGNSLEADQNTEYIPDRENTVSSKADDGKKRDNELKDIEDRNEIKAEPDIESEKKVLINRQNSYTWGPPGGWVCFAGMN